MQPNQSESAHAVHQLILEQRQKMSLSGVRDIQSFEEDNVLLDTVMGVLSVRGDGMKLGNFNAESGELSLSGQIYAFVYSEKAEKKSGFFKSLFR